MSLALKKGVVLFYMVLLGFSYLQLGWFLGVPSFGGFVLTPSAYPYIPPMSFVITVPSDRCEGWSVKLVKASAYGFTVYIPVVHYFNGGYEFFNAYILGPDPWQNIRLYWERLVNPVWVAAPAGGSVCVAEVVAVIPAPVVIGLMALALSIKLYRYYQRVW